MTTRVHYVHAFDPCGRLIIQAAGDGWGADPDIPDPEYSEYMRGQCELICNSVRLIRPDEEEGVQEIIMHRAQRLIVAAAHRKLDDLDPRVALSDFADEFPQRFEDDYLFGDEAAREAFASDALDFAAAPEAY